MLKQWHANICSLAIVCGYANIFTMLTFVATLTFALDVELQMQTDNDFIYMLHSDYF